MAATDPKLKDTNFSQPNLMEEAWFADRGRETKRPLRVSPTTPPPPIGDDLADRWFR